MNNSANCRRELLYVLKELKQATKPLLRHSPCMTFTDPKLSILSLLQIANGVKATPMNIKTDPNYYELYQLFYHLKLLLQGLGDKRGYKPWDVFSRVATKMRVYDLASQIDKRLQWHYNMESISHLTLTLTQIDGTEEDKLDVLLQFQQRLAKGFDKEYSDLIQKENEDTGSAFSILQSILEDDNSSKRVKDQAAVAMVSLVEFDEEEYLEKVATESVLTSLVSMGTYFSMKVLTDLVKIGKSRVIDVLEAGGAIPEIVKLLKPEDLSVSAATMSCILEFGFYGSKSVKEKMSTNKVIERLEQLDRMQNVRYMEDFPFEDCQCRYIKRVKEGEALGLHGEL